MFSPKPPEYKEFEDDRYLFNEQSIRKAFIRKVYLILMFQMIVSVGLIAWFMYDEPLRFYVETNIWPMITAMVVTFVVIITLACCGDVRKQFPLNLILLGVFTVAEGFILATLSAMTNSKIVLMAVGITAVVFLGLTLFSFQTRWDFTMSGGILMVCLIVLVVFGLIAMIFPGRTIILIYSSIGALIFGCYMVYDTQMLMGGDHKLAISPEEYIFAVLALYLDIVNFFVSILTILNASRR
ncbi:protein lifeguard 1-like [Coccinella septempunctata]|uniref:protein lifeguard 1-like n=1 Tax=Coccinella septempunctata TaxID=41139 RepID=UPI001D067EEA|nr:protein lifeguard 1-like [Coccinella septempunctata]